ncbi:hypothetical protein LXT23_44000 [Pyxidicoccus sp. QH1ED-7-1]|nr:hypothetical protein [Pyxidicoccus xibeiensis]MCP3144304.1 hypothetical protein [Pyxidicoccus xibeiensis]
MLPVRQGGGVLHPGRSHHPLLSEMPAPAGRSRVEPRSR